jgi:hypothetical protein
MSIFRRARWATAIVAMLCFPLIGTATAAHATTLRHLYTVDFFVANVNGTRIHGGANDAFEALHQCFNCSFPVDGGPLRYPSNGQYLPLKVCIEGVVCPLNAPVDSYDHEQQGYLQFVALAGHFDGAGSTVTFTFYKDSSGYLHLQVVGEVASPTIPDPVNIAGATNTWANFAENLGNFMGKFTCANAVCDPGRQIGCQSYLCDNLDPQESWTLDDYGGNYPGVPCSFQATNVGPDYAADGGGLQLRWGPHCQTNWARFTPNSSGTLYYIWVGRENPGYNTPGFEFRGTANVQAWSNQVYSPGPARACVLRWNGSIWTDQVCTPWF